MNIILLSGGSGKRLWPLSNDLLSKQFLKLLKNEHSVYESMVQRVARQIKTSHKNVNLYVSCNMTQEDILLRQLQDVETILEPTRRDTFPAVCLAAAYLHYEKGQALDAACIICPIDPYAEQKYFDLLKNVYSLVTHEGYTIGLMGALPTYPSEKYGYILQKSSIVQGFVEKPSLSKAAQLLAEGALWNCGVFALKIGYILEHAKKYIDFSNYNELQHQYDSLPKTSFDYAVVEGEKNLGVVEYDGVWKDLGTWNTLTEEMTDISMGDVTIADDCENIHVLNMLNIPIITQDTHNAVIIASHDGIYVSSKQGSSFLKPLAEKINQRPMYEQRRWGDYRVLEHKQHSDSTSVVKRIRVDAGCCMDELCTNDNMTTWVVIKGTGNAKHDGEDFMLIPGIALKIKPNVIYNVYAEITLEIIEVQVSKV